MKQEIFAEYERVLKQKDAVLKDLEQKRAAQAQQYENAIKNARLHYGTLISDLHSRCLKELNSQFRGDFDIGLSLLKKHLVGEDGRVSFAIYYALPPLAKSSEHLESLRNKTLWIKFYKKDQKGCPPLLSINFNPDQILISGKKFGSLVSYKKWGGEIVPIFPHETEDLLTINCKDVYAFAMREMAYKEYKNVQAIMNATSEEKDIQENLFEKENSDGKIF